VLSPPDLRAATIQAGPPRDNPREQCASSRNAYNPPSPTFDPETIAMTNKTCAIASLAFAALATVTCRPAAAADDGATLFKRYCFICHDTAPGKNKVGPSLFGVVGRASGSEDGYTYSESMMSAGLKWDEQTLDVYLANPRAKVPGTKMLFPGVKNPDDRHAIIDYLKSLKS
jgi:cytochrome c